MIRGTTPLHTFTLPFSTSIVDKVRVIYSQNDEIVLRKEGETCQLNENKVSVKLTQHDTFLFDCHYLVDIQVRVLTKSGDALTSLPKRIGVDKCLENEVL